MEKNQRIVVLLSMDTTLRKRFREKYRIDSVSGCWLWTASTAGKGYGQIKIPGTRRQVYAHRLSYEIHKGPVPKGMLVCHECDNPLCVNPDHLFLGTHGDNLQDMAAKDRHLKGERNTQSKLTEDQVHEIHDLKATGLSDKKIAERFGVGAMTVNRIVRGLRWHHVYLSRTARK